MAGASLFRVGDAVEFSRVLVHLSILVLFVIAFERGLHVLEHRLKRSPKYKEMLSKAYRELMIFGFVGLAIKICKEVTHVSADNASFAAFNVADLTIFILALALILQALCVFLRLRGHNQLVGHAELVSTADLADAIQLHEEAEAASKWRSRLAWSARLRSCATATSLSHSWHCKREVVELRVLRHIFLCRFGLPELFPFSKYIRQAQDSQITHMIDIEISTWFLLLIVAWTLEGAVASLRSDTKPHAFATIFVVFAWTLVALHAAVASYFDRCLRQLLQSAGYAPSHAATLACLRRIAQEEADAWSHELAGDALSVMQQVQEREEARRLKRKRRRHHLIESDTGFQLIATCFRHARRHLCSSMQAPSTQNEYTAPVETPSGDAGRPPLLLRQHSLAPVEIRWFSRKAWHFVVMFLLMLNGLYFALLLQCIVYRLGDVYSDFGWFKTLLIPLPIALNTLVLQPHIFRSFMIVCSIFRVHTTTLTEVITHFRETVELRSEFAASLSESLRARSLTVADLERELNERDTSRTGLIEVEKLRLVLRSFGLQLSHSRFRGVARLLFKTKGTQLEYAQVLRLLALVHQDAFAGASSAPAPAIHPLQHQLVLTEDGSPPTKGKTSALPAGATQSSRSVREAATPPRRGLLMHTDSQLFGASSRAIRCLYHIESMELDATGDASLATHYVRM